MTKLILGFLNIHAIRYVFEEHDMQSNQFLILDQLQKFCNLADSTRDHYHAPGHIWQCGC